MAAPGGHNVSKLLGYPSQQRLYMPLGVLKHVERKGKREREEGKRLKEGRGRMKERGREREIGKQRKR